MSSKRNLIVAAVVAVAVVIGYAAFTGKYPPKSGTEGAIGAASRYQAEQISAGDVNLEDASMQAFLQTDLFHQVATDASFRALLKNPNFEALARNAKFMKLASDPSAAEFLGRSRELLGRQEFAEMLKTQKFSRVVEQEKVVDLLRSPQFVAMASDKGFVTLLKDRNFDMVMEQAGRQKITSMAQLRQLVEAQKGVKIGHLAEMERNPAFVKWFESNKLQEAATQGDLADLAEVLETTKITALLQDEAFQDLLARPNALQLFSGEEMAKVSQSLMEMSRGPKAVEAFAVFKNPKVMEAFATPQLQQIAAAGKLEQAVSRVEN